jgi:DNA primase
MDTQHITEAKFNRFIRSAEAVKEALPIMELAPRYVDLRRQGGNYVALCPFHEERTPSFTVYADTNRFYCYGCKATGDVINLHHRCGNFVSLWDAMVSLAEEFGIKLLVRSDRWHQWADEKGRRRRMLRDNLAESYRRRYFRAFYSDYLKTVEPGVREEEAQRLWDGLHALSVLCAEQRMGG